MNCIFSPSPANSYLILLWLSFTWVTESFLLQAQKGSYSLLSVVLGRFGLDVVGKKSSRGARCSPETGHRRGSPSVEGFTAGLDRAMANLVQCWRWSCFDVHLQWWHKPRNTILWEQGWKSGWFGFCLVSERIGSERAEWELNWSQDAEKCTQELGHRVGTPWFWSAVQLGFMF